VIGRLKGFQHLTANLGYWEDLYVQLELKLPHILAEIQDDSQHLHILSEKIQSFLTKYIRLQNPVLECKNKEFLSCFKDCQLYS